MLKLNKWGIYMEKSCYKLAYYMYRKELVDKDSIDDLRFLIELILTQVITIVSVYLIGLVFMDALSILIICACFVAGRKYLDGYHASTFRNCYLLTILNFIFSLSMFLIMPRIEIFYLAGLLMSIYLLYRYHYQKIIIFNAGYLLLMVLFNSEVVYQINMVNYFVIILMRLIEGDELIC